MAALRVTHTVGESFATVPSDSQPFPTGHVKEEAPEAVWHPAVLLQVGNPSLTALP